MDVDFLAQWTILHPHIAHITRW